MVPALKKCVLFYLVAASIIPYGLDAWGQPKQKISRESRFKINFKQVKAEEFLQFLSEIAGLNFVYNPQDLNFSINLVSDEEMTIETIVSGFVQTLRIQGFSILEENGTLIIHQSPDVKEMPVLLSSEMLSQESVPPIVTKIYQIKNSSAETISTLIQPFLSKSSVIEAFPERKLLIISDVVQNILSIDSLVRTIDQPETGAVNIIYETQFFQPTELVSIASPILDSLCGGKSYSLLPQEGTQRVFIVGSPQLADKALEVFQQIEEKASKQQSSITTGNILLYRALNRSIQSIFIALKTIAKDSKKSEFNSSGFSKMVNEATLLVPDLLLFIGEPVEINKISSLIKTIDTPQQVKSDFTFSIIKLQHSSGKIIIDQLKSMSNDIPPDVGNADFLSALDTIRWNKDTNSVVIQGSPHVIEEITNLINKMDQPTGATAGFSVIKLQNVSGKFVLDQLQQMISQLPESSENMPFMNAVRDIQWNKTNNTLAIRGNPQVIQQLTDIITKLDVHTVSSTQHIIYTPNHMKAAELQKTLIGIANDLESSGTADPSLIQSIKGIKLIKNSNSIIVSGSEANIGKIKEMIAAVDKMEQPKGSAAEFSVIKLQNVSGKYVLDQLQQMISQLPESSENMPFMSAVKEIQWNKTNNTLTIRGNPQMIQQLTDIIAKLDVHTVSSTQYIIYKPNHMTAADLQKTLIGIANDLENSGTADPSLIQSIKGIKLIKNSNSIIVSGSEANIGKIKEMIAAVDKMEQPKESTAGFSVIKLQNVSGKYVLDQLQQMISQLPESSENMPFMNAVKDIQWNKTNNTLTIRGNPKMIQQLTDIITKLDVHTVSSTQHIIYTPNHMKAAELQKTLIGIANDLENSGTADPSLIQSIKGIKLIKNSNSILVSGSEANIGKIKEMIAAVDKIDLPTGSTAGFSVIKLQNVSGKYVLDQLQQMISQLPESPENMPFMNAVKEIQWNKTNNTLTIQGNPKVIQQLTDIIAKLDVHTVSSTQYIIYKPNHMTAAELQKTLIGIANDLESSGTADPSLIQSIKGIKLIKNSNSIIVSGSEANIGKIKEMIAAVDSQTQPSSKISQVGTATFLSYVPKTKSAKDLLAQLKSTTKNIASENPELIKTVNDAKISEGTIVFIGTPENLDRIQKLLESFDQKIPGTSAPREVDNYQNYKPVYKTGPELIKEVQGYVEHISDNGVNNQGLTKSVENLRFLNGRIVIVGAQENVTQILKLLQEFDTPSADLTKPSTTIESYENIGFLNYKLNFHTGSDIQIALKQIGEELQLTKNTKNESLVNAIASLQWIRVTNSLVATGDPQTLQKLKEIIASVDIPLKQVFIEVLVIETDTTNTLDVGLRWGGYSNFKGKFAGVGSNYPRVDSTDGITLQDVVKGTSTTAGSSSTGVNAINAPSPNLFNSLSSGQLGIIGDIIFHGGKSYLTLSSLLTALQEEARITTVLNQKIMAQDNRMSQIFVGQNIPFTGSIITTSGISQSTNANLEYRNIGVSLNITPNIGDNGIITLEIDEEITEEANPGTDSTGVNTQAVAGIRTKKSSMQTRVHVPDKAFVVLSGQIRNTQTKAKSGLPCLGGLPVIGAAFSQSSKNDSLSDIIIFIRPEIIQTSDQWKELSEQQEDIVREQTNPEQFDRAIDLVKRD